MPAIRPDTLIARSRGVRDNTHPRVDAGEILTPEDVLEGKGEMTVIDPDGNPEGMRIGRVEQPEYRHIYAGLSPDATGCTRQTTNGVPAEQSSWLGNQELVNGVPFPTGSSGLLAKLPKPEPPIIVKETTTNVGFAATTAQSPGWVALAFSRNGTQWGRLTPPVSYTNGHGQSLRVFLGDAGIGGGEGGFVGIFMPAPGTSTPTRPGPMFLVKSIDLSRYFLNYYDLPGPFRALRAEPTEDETGLGDASAPKLKYKATRYASQPGIYMACVTFTYGDKESAHGAFSKEVLLPPNLFAMQLRGALEDTEDPEPTGYGYMDIERPAAPPGATGWYCYVRLGIEWFRVWDRSTEQGRITPHPISKKHVWTAGWKGDENAYAQYAIQGLLTSGTPPDVDGTQLGESDSAPQQPVALGRARMGPGVLYFRVTDGLDGMQTLPSEPTSVNLADNEIPRVVFSHPVNRVPNGDHMEQSPNGLPLDHTFTSDNGTVTVEPATGEPILQTNSSIASATPTPTQKTSWMTADPITGGRAAARIALGAPKTGSVAGAVQLVLEEQDAAGAIVETILGSLSQIGEAQFDKILHPSGSTGLPGGSVILSAATTLFRLAVRFSGTQKNGSAKVVYLEAKRHKHRHRRRIFRWLRRKRRVKHPRPLPPPGSEVDCDPPNPPPPSPEPVPPTSGPPVVSPTPYPNRPLMTAGATGLGKILESLDFNSGLPSGASGWTQVKSAAATLAANATAAISGANGLFVSDQSTSENGYSYLEKSYGPTPFLGVSLQGRWGQAPTGGVVEMFPIRRESDGRPVAWLEAGEVTEVAELNVQAGPGQPGDVTINLNGTNYTITVGAVKEVSQLTITSPPTGGGTLEVRVGADIRRIPVGGTYEHARLKFTSMGFWSGQTRVSIGGISQNIPMGGWNYSASQAAKAVASYPFPGWQVVASGDTAYFYALTTGAKTDLAFDPKDTDIRATATTVTQGATETSNELAARIRATDFGSGWVLSGSTNVVTFTATRAGALTDIGVNTGTTGIGGTIATTAQGSADTPTQLATKIRNGPGGGYTGFTTGGSGTLVTFTATTSGDKQDASFSPGPTGSVATMQTTRRGQSSETFLKAQDDAGNIYSRKLTSPMGTSVWNVDFSVVGAGTEHAIISAWGSTGSDVKTLLERFDEVDLRESILDEATLGVTNATSAAVTWTGHFDNVIVTERGEKWFLEHDHKGALMNQLHHYGLPSQPVRDDIGAQELYAAVIPEATYKLSAFIFDEGAPAGTIPVSVRAFGPSGFASPIELGDLEVGGVDSDWREVQTPITIPKYCHLIEIRSRSLGPGTVIAQSIVLSPGTEAKRTGGYATSGSYSVILQLFPDNDRGDMSVARHRKMLEADTEEPEGTEIAATYRSAPSVFGPWSPVYTDPFDVPDQSYIEATFDMTGDGVETPELRPGSPRAEYITTLEGKHIACFLRSDRTELPGGAFFDHSEESSAPPDAAMRELRGGRLRPNRFGPGAPRMPGAEEGSGGSGSGGETVGLYVFTVETKRLIEEFWDENWAEEAYGEYMEVRLASRPNFVRIGGETKKDPQNPYFSHALYYAEMPKRQILDRDFLL